MFPISGELRRPGLSLLLQEERVRGVQCAGHRDGPRRPPRPRHLQLDQDCGHQEEEEKQQQPGQGTLDWRELEFSLSIRFCCIPNDCINVDLSM